MTSHATQEAGRYLSDATQKSSQVTVYYTEETGRKFAHFFTNIF
jgi:hypothetical protein